MLEYQVDNKIPYLCFLEDDILLENNFYDFINDLLVYFEDKNLNMLRLMKWGEGYITSYDSAIRILNHLKKDGIIKNIDNQLRCDCGKEIYIDNTPIKLIIPTNKGDCLKTKKIDKNLLL
jgi:hypothetical protein